MAPPCQCYPPRHADIPPLPDQRRTSPASPAISSSAPTKARPIRIGVIGSGEMGTDLVTQGMLMRGIEIAAIATRRPHTALEATAIAYGDTSHAVEADTPSKVTAAIEAGKLAITSADTLVRTPADRRRHRRHRQARRRRRLRPDGDGARQASRDDERRGRRHHRPLPQAAKPTGSASSIPSAPATSPAPAWS